MNSLPLFLQSALLMPLVAPLVEFATSTSGHVEPRQGLALGWLGSVVAGLAVVFGTADRAQADSCYGISPGSPGTWVCSNEMCAFDHHGDGLAAYDKYYVHSRSDHGCSSTSRSCSCPP